MPRRDLCLLKRSCAEFSTQSPCVFKRNPENTHLMSWSCVVKTQLEVIPKTARDRLPTSCCPAIGGQFEVANEPLPTFLILVASVPAILSNLHYAPCQLLQPTELLAQKNEHLPAEQPLTNQWVLRLQVHRRYYPRFSPQRRTTMSDEAHTSLGQARWQNLEVRLQSEQGTQKQSRRRTTASFRDQRSTLREKGI